jgi:hypothetical protein
MPAISLGIHHILNRGGDKNANPEREQGAKPETPVTTAQQEEPEPKPMETSTLKPASWASMSKTARKSWHATQKQKK